MSRPPRLPLSGAHHLVRARDAQLVAAHQDAKMVNNIVREMGRPPSLSVNQRKGPTSMNVATRRQDLRRIDKENERLLKKLESTKPTYQRSQQERSYKESRKHAELAKPSPNRYRIYDHLGSRESHSRCDGEESEAAEAATPRRPTPRRGGGSRGASEGAGVRLPRLPGPQSHSAEPPSRAGADATPQPLGSARSQSRSHVTLPQIPRSPGRDPRAAPRGRTPVSARAAPRASPREASRRSSPRAAGAGARGSQGGTKPPAPLEVPSAAPTARTARDQDACSEVPSDDGAAAPQAARTPPPAQVDSEEEGRPGTVGRAVPSAHDEDCRRTCPTQRCQRLPAPAPEGCRPPKRADSPEPSTAESTNVPTPAGANVPALQLPSQGVTSASSASPRSSPRKSPRRSPRSKTKESEGADEEYDDDDFDDDFDQESESGAADRSPRSESGAADAKPRSRSRSKSSGGGTSRSSSSSSAGSRGSGGGAGRPKEPRSAAAEQQPGGAAGRSASSSPSSAAGSSKAGSRGVSRASAPSAGVGVRPAADRQVKDDVSQKDQDSSDEDAGDASKSGSAARSASKSVSGVRSPSAGSDASGADRDEVRSARDSDDD